MRARESSAAWIVALGFWLLAWAVSAALVPVILDTDIGDDIDDTWALAMLLGLPQLDLKLVVTDYGNTPERTRLVAKVLQRAGRTDIPIGTGVKTGNDHLNQTRWVGDFDLGTYPGKVHADGVAALIDTIRAQPGIVTLITIGPVPNIKEALRRDPGIATKAHIVIENYDLWDHRRNHPRDASSILYDTAAVYLAYSEEYGLIETRKLTVNDEDHTLPRGERRHGRSLRAIQPLRWGAH